MSASIYDAIRTAMLKLYFFLVTSMGILRVAIFVSLFCKKIIRSVIHSIVEIPLTGKFVDHGNQGGGDFQQTL